MKKKIVIVDDDSNSLKVLNKTFEGKGYEIKTASDGKSTINNLVDFIPDLIIIDVILPDMLGTDLLVKIKTNPQYSDVIFILISGLNVSTEDYTFGMEIGASDYVRRPIKPKELLAKVEAFFKLKQTILKSRTTTSDMFNQNNTNQTSAIFDQKTINEANPELFQQFSQKYIEILKFSIEERFYKESRGVTKLLKDLSDELGFYKLSARDVINIHTESITKSLFDKSAQEVFVIKEESRIILIQLLGYLLNHYRIRCSY